MANQNPDLSYWQKTAAKLPEQNHEWTRLLLHNLQASHPARLAELAANGDLEAYLKVRVASATEDHQDLIAGGMEPATARELTLIDLLQPAAEEADQTEDWEAESAMADLEAAVERQLRKS